MPTGGWAAPAATAAGPDAPPDGEADAGDAPPSPTAVPGGHWDRSARGRRLLAPTVLLVGAAVLQVIALVPRQGTTVAPLGNDASNVAAQAVLAAGLLVAAVLIAPGRRAAIPGAAVAAGIVLADAGLVLSSVGAVQAGTAAGAGAILLAVAWLVGAAGAVLAALSQRRRGLGRPGRPRRSDNARLTVATAVAAGLLGVALLPSWDRYRLSFTGGVRTVELGSAFTVHNPGVVTLGDLIAAVMFCVVPIVAVLWRPGRIGILMTAGVLVVVASQAAEAVLQLSETTTSQFAPIAQARAVGLTVRPSLTAWYDIEVLAALVLLLLVAARWWTPADGSQLGSSSLDGAAPTAGWAQPAWSPPSPIAGSTADRPWGTAGYGAPPWSSPPGAGGPPQGSTSGSGTGVAALGPDR